MKLTGEKINRLGVFVFYDKDGIVDEYVLYILSSLKEAVNDIIILSNSKLDYAEKKKLFSYTDKVIIRNNIGFDMGAFKDCYMTYHEYFKTFDELVLLNDTFYGPFEPFKNIFKKMESKDVDFWGLGANYNSVDGYGFLPDNMIHSHIQSYFTVFRKNVLKSKAFNQYWQKYNIYEMNTFIDVVTKHELQFTYYLEKNGFKWDIYSDLQKYNNEDINANFNCYAYSSYEMIKRFNFPILKRKNLVFDKINALYLNDGADARRCLEYLEVNKLYNLDFIWENIIRLYNPDDIYYGLNLNFILNNSKKIINDKYVILLKLNNETYVNDFISLLKEYEQLNIFVTTTNEKIRNKILDNNLKLVNENSFDKTKYDYICLVNDVYLKKQLIPTVFENNLLNIQENCFEICTQIINIFLKNKHIGLLLLPENYHSTYFDEMGDINISIPCNSNCCWIRSELFQWNFFEEYDFVIQYLKIIKDYKYIVGKVYNIKSASNNLINQENILKTLIHLLKEKNTNTATYPDIVNSLKNNSYLINKSNMNELMQKIKRKIKKILRK